MTQGNVFKHSEAVRADKELAVPSTLQNKKDPKVFENVGSHILFGKGPAGYFNCTERLNCKLDVAGSTEFLGSRILDLETGTVTAAPADKPWLVKSLFFTEVAPDLISRDLRLHDGDLVVDLSRESRTLNASHLERQLFLVHFGAGAVFLDPATETAYLA